MDRRDLASSKKWWDSLHGTTALLKDWSQEDAEGEPMVIKVECEFEVCPTCNGRGSYVNPNIDRHGLTQEDFDEDPEFFEEYQSGMYDLECGHCQGMRVIPIPLDKDMLKRIRQEEMEMEAYYAEVQAEINFGA